MMSVVRIDDTDELEKLYILARRAIKAEDYENAQKYYEMILPKNPLDWEATIYSSATKLICTNENYGNLVSSLIGSIRSSMQLIKDSKIGLNECGEVRLII